MIYQKVSNSQWMKAACLMKTDQNSQTTEGSRRNKKKEDKKIRASSIVKADIDDDIHVSEE